MMLRRVFAFTLALALLHVSGFAQSKTPGLAPTAAKSPDTALAIADVHPSPNSFHFTYLRVMPPARGRYALHQATLLDLIVTAYGVEPKNVLGGPSWIDFDRFDVTAQIPSNATQADANLVLRSVLAQRFKLAAHTDMKPVPALLLRAGSGPPKLKPVADPAANSVCQHHQPSSLPAPGGPPPTTLSFSCRNLTMEQYAQDLHRMFSDKPVVDLTALKGAWDFDVTYTLRPDRQGIDFADAIEKQLGLKVEPGTTPQPVVVVDSAVEQPTTNPPGLEKILPPPPPLAFDVAVIKPSAQPSSGGFGVNREANQVRFTNISIQGLISYAWDMSAAMIADPPAWIDKDHWDVLAKWNAEPPPAGNPGAPQQTPPEDVRAMVRTLLADRFQLKSHSENRIAQADAYTLFAANPRMKKADPANRTSCKEGPAPGAKDPRATNPTLSEVVTCQNVTMAQFASEIQYYARDYIKTPVLNATNLDGAYDLTLSFSSRDAARGVVTTPSGGAAPPPSTDPSASSDPSGAISLPDAMFKQLGLRLEMQKRSVPMLVIDHVEPKPTDN
jgi:uncharacterized protein (TIGR03435 family)